MKTIKLHKTSNDPPPPTEQSVHKILFPHPFYHSFNLKSENLRKGISKIPETDV